jgi:predicted kinase
VPETEPLPASAYTPQVTARVYSTLVEQARRVLAAGHSVVVDAVFAKRAERDAIAEIAPSIPFHGLFLTADLATRIARIGARKDDASDADPAIARAQEHYDLGGLEWTGIDASGTPRETLLRSQAALGQ